MKRERKQIEDMTLNNIFAAAFDYLRRNYRDEFGSRKALAEKMGMNKDSITNIMKGYTAVSEEAITNLQTACGCIFNLQWLRGQSDVMLAKDLKKQGTDTPSQSALDATVAAIIAAKDEIIAGLKREHSGKDEIIDSLKRELKGKDETIASKDEIIATKDALIANLQRQLDQLRLQSAMEKGVSEDGRSLSAHVDAEITPPVPASR